VVQNESNRSTKLAGGSTAPGAHPMTMDAMPGTSASRQACLRAVDIGQKES
jgi:hypothetical protein